MTITITGGILLICLAAFCSLNMTAFGQFMVSRPIFCGPLFGLLLGDITTGLWIGMIVELVWSNAVPLGVAIPIDVSSITILAVFWSCKNFGASADIQAAAMWGLVFAVPFAYLYREVEIAGRNFNIKVMRWVEKGVQEGKESRINSGIFIGLFLFIIRLFVFYGVVMFLCDYIYKGIFLQFTPFIHSGLKKAWYILPVLGFGAALYNFRSIFLGLKRK